MKPPIRALVSVVLVSLLVTGGRAPRAEAGQPRFVYLPLVSKPGDCPANTGNSYAGGGAYQYDSDNPVRPPGAHADKNLGLRGYSGTTPNLLVLVDYGSTDPIQPPQLATLFNPSRLPTFSNTYRANQWTWADSPAPGTPNGPITDWPVTVLGLATTPGEALRVPTSGYNIGNNMEVLVLYADADSLALKYTREDSAATGYLVHVDNICTDPNLLALYTSLDSGARYIYHGPHDQTVDYNLPNLPAGAVFGTARGSEIRVALVDTGAFMDPRSCNEWWQVRPEHPGC